MNVIIVIVPGMGFEKMSIQPETHKALYYTFAFG